jgi:hypothetical protein
MSLAPPLSVPEFSSLVKIGCGALLGAPIPSEHLLKLTGLRYIEIIDECYETTASGQFRIASGS